MGKISQHSTQASAYYKFKTRHAEIHVTRRLLISTAHICNFLASFKETCHLFRPQGGHLNILLAQEWGICSFQKKKWHTPRTGRGKYRWKAFPPVREVTPCVSNTTVSVTTNGTQEQLDVFICDGLLVTPIFVWNWAHSFLFICSFVCFFSQFSQLFSQWASIRPEEFNNRYTQVRSL